MRHFKGARKDPAPAGRPRDVDVVVAGDRVQALGLLACVRSAVESTARAASLALREDDPSIYQRRENKRKSSLPSPVARERRSTRTPARLRFHAVVDPPSVTAVDASLACVLKGTGAKHAVYGFDPASFAHATPSGPRRRAHPKRAVPSRCFCGSRTLRRKFGDVRGRVFDATARSAAAPPDEAAATRP